MALKSDITINVAKFDPASISEQTAKLNQHIIDIFEPVPKWYDVSLPALGLISAVVDFRISRSVPQSTVKCALRERLLCQHPNCYLKRLR